MTRKDTIHKLLNDASLELLAFIKDSESKFQNQDHWVPAAEIKNELDLNTQLRLCSKKWNPVR